jgi:ABC-type antimicrobial peptide transport system permease subunit
MTFEEHLEQQELDEGRTQEVNRSLALALFFLINLMLAVIGTVWLHAKRHTEECGVRRAFGATRRQVLWDFLWRNALLATAAVAVGLVIYLNYAYSGLTVEYGKEHCETLYMNNIIDVPTDKTWVDYFWPHFLVVSSVVYIIILCTVLIGTAIPAVKIIKTKITNALRDE